MDETEVMVDTTQAYREGLNLYLDLATGEHKTLLEEISAGIDPGVYKAYARMLDLNEVCEKFVIPNQEKQSAA